MTTLLTYARFAKDELGIDPIEVAQQIHCTTNDFEVGGYRFILSRDIDEIQQDELSSDEYVLGCFNASFLASVTDLPFEMIEACHQVDQYQAVGQAILNGNWLEDVQREYASADGYGHHFSHYDGSEREIGGYYVFRIS